MKALLILLLALCLAASLPAAAGPDRMQDVGGDFGGDGWRVVQRAVRSLQERLISSVGERVPREILWRAGMQPMSKAGAELP